MKTVALITYSLLLIPSLFAASAKNSAESTAEGYPAWTGITPENRITGRTLISGADLRQRVATVVIEFDASKTAEQLEKMGKLAVLNGLSCIIGHGSTSWETVQFPRDVLFWGLSNETKGCKMLRSTNIEKLAVRRVECTTLKTAVWRFFLLYYAASSLRGLKGLRSLRGVCA